LDTDLVETQYLVEIDNRFASLAAGDQSGLKAEPSYIDDDNIATYYFSRGVDVSFIGDLPNSTDAQNQVIAGPRGTYLNFKLISQNEVASSDYLFNQLGKEIYSGFSGGSLAAATSVRSILTNIRVTGVTTGNTVDIPLLIVKKIAP